MEDRRKPELVLVHSARSGKRNRGGDAHGAGRARDSEHPAFPVPVRSRQVLLSQNLYTVEQQLLEAFPAAPLLIAGRVVNTMGAEDFWKELLAKGLVRGYARIIFGESGSSAYYACVEASGLIHYHMLSRSFYAKILSCLQGLAGMDMVFVRPLFSTVLRVGFEQAPETLPIGVVIRMEEDGASAVLELQWDAVDTPDRVLQARSEEKV